MDEEMNRLFEPASEIPAALAETIRARIHNDTRPVKPLPGVAATSLLFGGVLAVVATIFVALIGFKALQVLAPAALVEMLAVLLALAFWAAVLVARSMRPAAGRVNVWLPLALAMVSYETLVLTLFGDYSMGRFVHQGIACLLLGLLGAAVASLPVWLIVRQGFVVQPMRAGAAMGLVTGLAGLAALTLHCPILTVPHAAVWHAAVVAICTAAGALAGHALRSRPYKG
jgi:hypothetical protein